MMQANSDLPLILVTAAAGRTGSAAARQLLELGYPVRALVHREDARSARLREAGAEIVVGDIYDMRDLQLALVGVRRAYYCPPIAPNLLHGVAMFALAVEEAGLESVTLLSQWTPHPTHPSVVTREHWLANNLLRWMPTVLLAHVNPGLFADIYLMATAGAAQFGMFTMPIGDGRNAPPSSDDIARCVVATLIDPPAHAGESYRPTGPTLLSGSDMAAIFAKVLDRKVAFRDISNRMLSKVAAARGFPLFEISQLGYYLNDQKKGAFEVGAPTDHVRLLTGREPEDFETILRRHVRSDPEAEISVRNWLRMMRILMKAALTRVPDLQSWESGQGHPMLDSPLLAIDSQDWVRAAASQSLHLVAANQQPSSPTGSSATSTVAATARVQ